MNAIIVGFGTAGKYYFNLLKKNKKIKNIYILENRNIKKNNFNNHILKNLVQFKKSKINLDYAIIATPSHLHFKYAEFFKKKNKCFN